MVDASTSVDWRTLFDLAMVVVSMLGGWLLKSLFTRLRDLERADVELVSVVSELRVDVAKHYVSKPDFERLADNIFQALRRIEDKLDGKADKE